MLASKNATNPKNAPIFRSKLIFLKLSLYSLEKSINITAYPTTAKPKIIEKRNKK